MGKRELLLVVVFVVLGVGVYQVTAPAAPADSPGFSLERLFQFARAHFQGPRERRTVTRTATLAPGAGVSVVDLGDIRGTVIVEGSDRADILVTLESGLAGLDAADLDAQEKALGLDLTAKDETATVGVRLAEQMRRPRHELRVSVPRRLRVRLGGRGVAEVRDVAGLQLVEYRGELTTDGITGPITGDVREARIEFGEGASIQIRAENARIRAESPATVDVDGERGSIEIVDPQGPVTLKTDYARMNVRGTGGPVTVTGEGGVITLREVAHPLTMKAERLTVDAELQVPVATVIEIEDDTVEVTLPREGGVQLEASIEDGTLRVPTGLTPVKSDRKESVTAAVGGGGPLVKVTVNRGELRIRSRGTVGTE